MSRSNIAFGTDGWRAVIADQFTMENVRIVAQAIASFTIGKNQQEQGIIVGYDTRFMGRSFAFEVASVLAGNGISVYLANEATPTPVVAFGVKHFAVSGAVMITASHNPPEYNGIKYIPDYAGPATPDITRRLEELIATVQHEGEIRQIYLEEAIAKKTVQYIFLRPHYEAHLRRIIDFQKLRNCALRVVVDPMHGAGTGYISSLLGEAGIAVSSIRDEEDPLFGGGLPEPSDRHLSELKWEVIRGKADLGLANDGDADRFGVVDGSGRYVSANQVLALLAHHLLKNRGLRGKIVRTVATTHLLDRIAAKHGLALIETPVGFKYIGQEMSAGDILLGGEESGGASMIGHIPEKDGILINLLLTEMCAWEQKRLDQILDELHKEYGEFHHTRIDIKYTDKEDVMGQLLKEPPMRIASFAVKELRQRDGIKFLLEEGHWLLIRPSGTEPLLRIYCEATTATALEKIVEAVRDLFGELP